MGTIFLHQLAEHVTSMRFHVGLALVVGLFAVSSAMHVQRYQRMADVAPHNQRDVEDRYGRAQDLNGLASTSLRLMNERLPTEFMAEGGVNWFGDSFYMSAETGGSFYYGGCSRFCNHWVRRYNTVDWSLLVRLVVSFLCIVLVYDSLSGERERGTLRLMLANPVPRARVMVAKVGAGMAVVMAATSVGSLLSIAILTTSGAVPLTTGLLGEWLLYLAGIAVYASIFLLVGVAVSALARTSGASLMLLVLAWVVLIVVLPQTAYLVAVKTVDIEPRWRGARTRAVIEARERLAGQGIAPRRPEVAGADGYLLEQRYLRGVTEAERRGEAELADAFGTVVRQYRVARAVSMLSPGMAFQYSAEALLRTGLGRYLNYERQVWRYRETLRAFVRGRDAADPESPHLYFLAGFLSERPLDDGDVPRFMEEQLTLGKSLQQAWTPILLLLGEVLAGMALALWAVNRMEV